MTAAPRRITCLTSLAVLAAPIVPDWRGVHCSYSWLALAHLLQRLAHQPQEVIHSEGLGQPLVGPLQPLEVVFWKFFDSESADQPTEDRPQSFRRCMARAYCVFNAEQVDGFKDEAPRAELSQAERIEGAERFFTSLPASIRHGGNQAFYSPTADYIQMPPFAQFTSAFGYYSTLAHEYTHYAVWLDGG